MKEGLPVEKWIISRNVKNPEGYFDGFVVRNTAQVPTCFVEFYLLFLLSLLGLCCQEIDI